MKKMECIRLHSILFIAKNQACTDISAPLQPQIPANSDIYPPPSQLQQLHYTTVKNVNKILKAAIPDQGNSLLGVIYCVQPRAQGD